MRTRLSLWTLSITFRNLLFLKFAACIGEHRTQPHPMFRVEIEESENASFGLDVSFVREMFMDESFRRFHISIARVDIGVL